MTLKSSTTPLPLAASAARGPHEDADTTLHAAPGTFRQDNLVLVPPRSWDGARTGKCYNNVLEMIRRHGGEVVFGWAATDNGPLRLSGWYPPPLYRRWLNHAVWRDLDGKLWEVSPQLDLINFRDAHFLPTEFLVDEQAAFTIRSESEWYTRGSRYVALRPEGEEVVRLLNLAQQADGESARTECVRRALAALADAGFTPREWKMETVHEETGDRTGSIWLIAE